MIRSRLGLAYLGIGGALAALAHPAVAGALWTVLGGRAAAAVPAERLAALALAHGMLVLLALPGAAILGLGLGLAVTREGGRTLRPAADALVAASQAVPPVVVVALALPALGFGPGPTVLALGLYGLMPILRGAVAAFEATPGEVREAARAMGLTPVQILREVEAPLAAPLILDALRVALVLCVATAAVGALAGAATLGTPVIVGLQNGNELAILQGSAATAALAFAADGTALVGIAGAERLLRKAVAV